MDTLQSALCLLLGSALPLALLFAVVRRGWRQFSVSHAYAEVSRQLGLDVDTRGTSLQGHLGDRRIWIGEVMIGHGPSRQMVTWGVLDLARPLGLGLLVRRKDRRTRLLRRGQAVESHTGDPDLDKVLEVQGDDPRRVRALFDPPVRAALARLIQDWPDVALTDRGIRVHLSAAETSVDRLRGLVGSMLGVAEAIEEARQAVEVPTRLVPVLQWWEPMATSLGLQVEPWLPAATGELHGHRVLITCRREPHGYRALLRLWFKPHAATGLRLRRQTEPDGYWNVGQDIQLGDPAVDAAFVVKGWDPDRVVEILSVEVRQALVDLCALGKPEVDDRCLYIEELELDQDTLERAATRARELATAIGW